jgi:hypothetical protein
MRMELADLKSVAQSFVDGSAGYRTNHNSSRLFTARRSLRVSADIFLGCRDISRAIHAYQPVNTQVGAASHNTLPEMNRR